MSSVPFFRMVGDGHIELANQLARSSWFSRDQIRDLHAYALVALDKMATLRPRTLHRLITQPWFADGLDNHEAAFVVTLSLPSYRDQLLYEDLLQSHFIKTNTVSLPLAGEVSIWVEVAPEI